MEEEEEMKEVEGEELEELDSAPVACSKVE